MIICPFTQRPNRQKRHTVNLDKLFSGILFFKENILDRFCTGVDQFLCVGEEGEEVRSFDLIDRS